MTKENANDTVLMRLYLHLPDCSQRAMRNRGELMTPSFYLPTSVLLLCCAILSCDVKAQPLDPNPVPEKRRQFSLSYLNPCELQFGCWGTFDEKEEKLGKLLDEGEPHEQLAAARELWEGHSRRTASAVLTYLSSSPPGGEGFRKFQREVEASLQPEAILNELKDGDYLWGSWLAFLRPHEKLVPNLLAALKPKPCGFLPVVRATPKYLNETIFALGNSGDPRAYQPLLELLKSDDFEAVGFAARALGYFGNRDVVPLLIKTLTNEENTWLQVNACIALGMLGSRETIPALEKLAKDDRFTGVWNVQGAAKRAIKRITKRENP
jgi:hypothetical protein